jgi:hypothetical protein
VKWIAAAKFFPVQNENAQRLIKPLAPAFREAAETEFQFEAIVESTAFEVVLRLGYFLKLDLDHAAESVCAKNESSQFTVENAKALSDRSCPSMEPIGIAA